MQNVSVIIPINSRQNPLLKTGQSCPVQTYMAHEASAGKSPVATSAVPSGSAQCTLSMIFPNGHRRIFYNDPEAFFMISHAGDSRSMASNPSGPQLNQLQVALTKTTLTL